jgi:hypothetical protein
MTTIDEGVLVLPPRHGGAGARHRRAARRHATQLALDHNPTARYHGAAASAWADVAAALIARDAATQAGEPTGEVTF